MPLHQNTPFTHPYMTYEAHDNEKSKEIREKFKIDESGYPEQYKFRDSAQLGASFKPHEPFDVFKPVTDNELIGSNLAIVCVNGFSALALKGLHSSWTGKPFLNSSWIFVGGFLFLTGGSYWIREKSYQRQALKSAMFVDYMKRHPERFPPIKRYKHRETLFLYTPIR